MPIEIRELVIKAFIEDNKEGKGQSSGSTANSDDMKEEIIADCMEQISEMLKDKRER